MVKEIVVLASLGINKYMKQTLYLKTHRQTGLKYLGKTSSDPFTYPGSGVRWTNHLRVHGNDVDTQILAECESNEEIAVIGEYYSTLWNVVESDEFANLKPETGDGGSYPHREETKKKISDSKKGKAPPNKGKTYSNPAMSKAMSGKGNPMFGKIVVNDGVKNLVIDSDCAIPDGFVRGAIQNAERKRIANALNVGVKNSSFGKRWVNNDVESKMIDKDLPIPEGWVEGRKIGKFWITDGVNNMFVSSKNIIPEGWYKGRKM